MNAPRILLADDEPALAEYLRARLAALWPEARLLPVARNGVEALASIREHEPDAAFLDIRMPGLTGLELAARIEGATHVVFVTAYDQYAVEAFDRNAVDYLVKPVADDRLARAVERLKAKLATREAPPGIGEVLARIAASLPGATGGFLRWVRALKGEEIHQIAVEDVFYF
ncbi:MAG TPA: response regulator, partial [Usitatibacteraceae bacterium]|nr:response regulator [Usitatibacteraceae bacterium]